MTVIRCPSCQIERDVPSEKLPKGLLRLNCKNCQKPFEFDNDSLPADAPDQPLDRTPFDLPPPKPEERAQTPAPAPATVTAADETFELDWGDRAPPARPSTDEAPAAALPTDFSPAPLAPVVVRRAALRQPPPSEPFGYDHLGVNGLSYPFFIALAALALSLGGTPLRVLAFCRTAFHELGHATVAWLSSRAATPLAILPGFGFSSVNPNKSVLVFMGVLFLITVLGYRAVRGRSPFLLAMAVLLLLGQVGLTFLASPALYEEASLIGGTAGELVLGTLCAASFYYRFPPRMLWGVLRFPALALGVASLSTSFWFWLQVAIGALEVPWGTCVGGTADAAGDMNRLHDHFAWSAGELTALFFGLAGLCVAALVGHYVVFLARALAQREALLER